MTSPINSYQVRHFVSLRLVTLALGALSLALPACCEAVPPSVSHPASPIDARSDEQLRASCEAASFGSCLALSDRYLARGQPERALSVMVTRCKQDSEERTLTAKNACFSAIIMASRELADEGRAWQLARYRCARFEGAIGCDEVRFPARLLSDDASAAR